MKPYQVTINFGGLKFAFKVYQIVQKNNVEIYQLKRSDLSYVIINENQNWSFLGALEPCQELKDVIVKRLKGKGPNKYMPQKLTATN
jgi:hypothetical protein